MFYCILMNPGLGIYAPVYFCFCGNARFMYESGAMKQNNFAQITDYFLQRDIVAGVAGVTGKEAMEIAGEFLLSVLNSSDNAGNVYDDDYFVADMLTCTARMWCEAKKCKESCLRNDSTQKFG